MEKVNVYENIYVGCPEGFHVLDEEEKKGYNSPAPGPGIIMKDDERHMVVSIGVQKLNGFSGAILSQKDISRNMEKSIAKSMSPYGYELAANVERKAGNDTAYGMAYEYTAQEIEMYAESLAVKKGKTVVYYHLYSRKAFKDENLAVWEEILGSVEM